MSGKLFAVLGDIHANIDALNAVMDDCRREGATDFLCTGDVVGYNAAPSECLKVIRDLNCPVVKGNHDHYVSSRQNLADFHPNAAYVVEWTRRQLELSEMLYLHNLPFQETKMGICLVHATMDHPEGFGYVFDRQQAELNFICQKTPVCFHGHTHCPMIFEKGMNGIVQLDVQEYKLQTGKKYFINVGSVGQPRDGDPRAAYVLYDPIAKTVRFKRLEYDVEAAQAKIIAAGLPQRLADRLALGQ